MFSILPLNFCDPILNNTFSFLPWIVDMNGILGFFSYLSKDSTTGIILRINLSPPTPSLTNIVTMKIVFFNGLQIASKISGAFVSSADTVGSPSKCRLCSSHFYFLGENISNEHVHAIITGGKFQHRSVGFLDDRGPLPSCRGKYHIYNFGNRTGALVMWIFFFFKRDDVAE